MNSPISLTFDTQGVDWAEAARIFELAPLGTREPDALRQAFGGSDLVCFAWDSGPLVAVGRALSDGVMQSVVYDLCMLPEYQGGGLGTRMMQEMLSRLGTKTVALWSVPEKEGFYSRLGFRPMLTAMALMEDPQKSAAKGYIRL